MANHVSSLGPSPQWHDARAPFLGFATAIALAVTAVLVEAALTLGSANPGVVLDWLPLAAAALALGLAVRSTGALRDAALTGAITLLALFAFANPAPAAWMSAAPVAAAVLALGLRLEPATRVVAAAPALLGLLLVLQTVPALASTMVAILVAGLYTLALWFTLPYASGWRRVPFLVDLALALLVPLAFIVAGIVSISSDGVSRPDAASTAAGGPGIAAVAFAALALAGPLVVVLLWRNRRAQGFLLPTLALPSRSESANPVTHETSEQA